MHLVNPPVFHTTVWRPCLKLPLPPTPLPPLPSGAHPRRNARPRSPLQQAPPPPPCRRCLLHPFPGAFSAGRPLLSGGSGHIPFPRPPLSRSAALPGLPPPPVHPPPPPPSCLRGGARKGSVEGEHPTSRFLHRRVRSLRQPAVPCRGEGGGEAKRGLAVAGGIVGGGRECGGALVGTGVVCLAAGRRGGG